MHIGHIKESLNKVFVEHLTHLSGRDADVAATMRESSESVNDILESADLW